LGAISAQPLSSTAIPTSAIRVRMAAGRSVGASSVPRSAPGILPSNFIELYLINFYKDSESSLVIQRPVDDCPADAAGVAFWRQRAQHEALGRLRFELPAHAGFVVTRFLEESVEVQQVAGRRFGRSPGASLRRADGRGYAVRHISNKKGLALRPRLPGVRPGRRGGFRRSLFRHASLCGGVFRGG